MNHSQEILPLAIQLFPREDKTISFWDHPNFKSRVALPDNYIIITREEQGIELIQQGVLDKEALILLKVIGDAMCANENQLRRYMIKKLSFSQTSAIIAKLRKYSLVERHVCRLAFLEDDGEEFIRPPAPFTLGIGGYKLIKHMYPESRLMEPNVWREQPLSVQRYVAMNETRCLLVETGTLRGWAWNPYIGGSAKYMRPFGVAKVDTPKGEMHILFERPQMAQNFLGFFKTKFEQYRFLYERDNYFRIDEFKKPQIQIVCLYVSSFEMAKYIQEEMNLQNYPFEIWLLIDEWIDEKKGMSEAFCIPVQLGKLKRIRKIPFFEPLNNR